MVWAKGRRTREHSKRSRDLTTAFDTGGMPTHLPSAARGSRGGAPIWVAHGEGFGLMPSPCTCGTAGDGPATTSSDDCPAHGSRRLLKQLMDKGTRAGGRWGPRDGPETPPYRKALAGGHDRGFSSGPKAPAYESARGVPHVTDDQGDGDPDGYAVFGRFPKGLLTYILRLRLLGDMRRADVLHVCSGTLGTHEAWTVDVRPEARPRVVADGCALPFRDESFKAVLMDPPYSDAYARNLYGTENPRPSWLLREASRVVEPGGRIGILHVALPFCPPHCDLVRVVPVSTGLGFRVRALTIYQRRGDHRQGELL